ncbi:tetratricopeptide repeat protein [Spirosoma panaciterrae]|uniref:tetratricopeptide repeat protein n=1 Tax=Spirosoma panaciterrae TaxID=496058 RepID=UPI001B7F97DE|nr:tetratricopeptide repeat protein [Spirosoma panaciterrae]
MAVLAAKDSLKRAELLEGKALSSLKLGNYDQAFSDYEKAALLNPKSQGRIGWRYLFFLRDYKRACNYLEAFDAQTPGLDDPIDDYSVNYLKGRAYVGLKQYKQAIDAYTVAIHNREARNGLEWVDYRYLVARAVSYLAVQQPEKALYDLDNALKNNPKSAMAHYHRGCALQQLNRTKEALTAFRDALFFVQTQPFERDFYYEQPDAAYEGQIEAAIQKLKPLSR